jgi:hypothetical protein
LLRTSGGRKIGAGGIFYILYHRGVFPGHSNRLFASCPKLQERAKSENTQQIYRLMHWRAPVYQNDNPAPAIRYWCFLPDGDAADERTTAVPDFDTTKESIVQQPAQLNSSLDQNAAPPVFRAEAPSHCPQSDQLEYCPSGHSPASSLHGP